MSLSHRSSSARGKDEKQKIRVLIAKPGLDGHEMGARLITRALMDAGMEVIYTGPRQTPEAVVATALQEDVDVIGLSFLTGAHKEHTSKIVRLMEQKNFDLNTTLLVIGGIIPPKDTAYLKSIGADEVFGPGSDTRAIVQRIAESLKKKRAQNA